MTRSHPGDRCGPPVREHERARDRNSRPRYPSVMKRMLGGVIELTAQERCRLRTCRLSALRDTRDVVRRLGPDFGQPEDPPRKALITTREQTRTDPGAATARWNHDAAWPWPLLRQHAGVTLICGRRAAIATQAETRSGWARHSSIRQVARGHADDGDLIVSDVHRAAPLTGILCIRVARSYARPQDRSRLIRIGVHDWLTNAVRADDAALPASPRRRPPLQARRSRDTAVHRACQRLADEVLVGEGDEPTGQAPGTVPSAPSARRSTCARQLERVAPARVLVEVVPWVEDGSGARTNASRRRRAGLPDALASTVNPRPR